MKKLKILSVLIAITLIFCTIGSILPVSAVEGYKEGDVIYLDYSALPDWHTPNGGSVNSILYINFTNNTRYDSGVKETVIIGQDTARFNPKRVTEQVDEYVYKYVVTAEDAGASTLMFWRGSDTNLWNNSVELTYSEYSQGKNLVVVTDWTSAGYTDVSDYNPYSIQAAFDITPEDINVGDEVTVKLSYVSPIDEDNVTYTYEIYDNDEKIESDTYTFTVDNKPHSLKGVVSAYINDELVAQAEVRKNIYLGAFNVINPVTDTLYAHAFTDSGIENEAWVKCSKSSNQYTFYLPPSADTKYIELFSTYASNITVDSTTVQPLVPTVVPYSENTTSKVTINGRTYNLKFMNSTSEAALFVNNDLSKTDNLWDYLSADKENSSSATASIVDRDGEYENVGVKKIKGRGNTTWNNSSKKPFNINFDSTVTVGTMQSTKQYSLLANFQDPAMARNRILYDLGDAVGLRYSCDSRFVDFYVDGVYKGQYQMCQKIEAGKKNLITGVDDDGYLTDDNQLKEDFAFLIEMPFEEDFCVKTDSGIYAIIKSPDVEGNDNLYANEVKAYVKEKFDAMYNALTSNADNLDDYIDIDSLAICYLVQELGKNWDTHSWYMVYEPDENGNYKFYASPVWDFDNSIGNANGVQNYLDKFGVDDYTEYSGWWCKYKDPDSSINMSTLCTKNNLVMDRAKSIWFERFVPAIETFASNGIDNEEIFSADVYYNSLYKSADMNYSIWNMTVDNGWVSNHSSLNKAEFDFDTLTYKVNNSATRYDQYSFKGQYDYMADWFTSRAAWISNEWKDSYNPYIEILLGDCDEDGAVTIKDATNIQKYLVDYNLETFNSLASDTDEDTIITIKDSTAIQKHLADNNNYPNIGTYIKVYK